MKVADVIGRRITGVQQHRVDDDRGRAWSVDAFELDNGSVVFFEACEHYLENVIEVQVVKQPRIKRKD